MEQAAYYSALIRWTTTLRKLQAHTDALCRAAHIDLSHYLILLCVLTWDGPQPPIIRDVATALSFQHHATLGLLKTLEARGYVRREGRIARRENRKTHVVALYLTEAGRQLTHAIADQSRDALYFSMPTIHDANHGVMHVLGLVPHENGEKKKKNG